jgi:Ca-activated chloride channel homolog
MNNKKPKQEQEMKTNLLMNTIGLAGLLAGCATLHGPSEDATSELTVEPAEPTPSPEAEDQEPSPEDAVGSTEVPFEAIDVPSASNPDAFEGMRAKKEEGKVGSDSDDVPSQPMMEMAAAESVVESQAFIQLLGTRGESDSTGGIAGHGGLGSAGVGMGSSAYSTGSKGRKAKRSSPKMSVRSSSSVPFSDLPMIAEEIESPVQGNSEEYTDYGINPFTSAADDAVSTFSIDVDTASYTIARRKLNEGTLPPFSAVRVEEYVNYLDYGYESGEASPFTVDMEAMEDPFREDRHIFRVGVQGMEYTTEDRPTLHLTFLADISGSMTSVDKLPLAQKAMHLMVDEMREDDTVALATYAGAVRRVLAPTSGKNKAEIHAAIDQLTAGGSTAMSSGMDLAYEMAWSRFEPGAENRVVVLSDGDANVGRTGWQDMLSQIKSYADRGVTMSTIGFGMGNYKDTRMEQLSNKGDGNNFYIDSYDQAKRVFVEDFGSSMITIARDVKIQVEFNPELVSSYRLIGYENRDIADKDFRNDRVDAGEVGAGHNVTALYELILTDKAKRKSGSDMATTRLRYESPGADKAATEKSWTFAAGQAGQDASDASKELRLAYTAGTFAEVLRRSPHASGISMDELIAFGSEAKRRGEKDDQELLELIRKAKSLGAGQFVASR